MSVRPQEIAALRKLARTPSPSTDLRPGERCELCATVLGAGHEHLLEGTRLACACPACALLFENGGRFKRVRPVVRALEPLDGLLEKLDLPIQLAYFVHQGDKVVAFYPSPAGAMRSTLAVEDPRLERLAPDLEAIIVNRLAGARDDFLVSIDVAAELVGEVRRSWRGLSPSLEVVEEFFQRLRERAA